MLFVTSQRVNCVSINVLMLKICFMETALSNKCWIRRPVTHVTPLFLSALVVIVGVALALGVLTVE